MTSHRTARLRRVRWAAGSALVLGLSGIVPATAVAAAPAVLGAAAASAPAVLPAARSDYRISLKSNWGEFRKGESIRLRGYVSLDGRRTSGKKVAIWAASGSGKSSKVVTVKTNSKGKFTAWVRPTKDVRYVARVGDSESRALTLDRTVGDRALADRERTVRAHLGAARTGASKLSRAERKDLKKPSIASVTYRQYAKAMLVQVVKTSGKTRTWLVRGKILKAYLKAGGPDGKYGVPVHDARCSLMESGCLQRFTGGSLYEKKSLRSAYGQTGKTKATEMLAVARSQLSYRSTRLKSKYNKWTGSVGQPWCSAFQSWVASAAGSPSAIPKFARIHQLAPYARKNMTTFKNGSKKYKIKRGTLAFYDFRNGGNGPEPSHVGMVISSTRSTIVTLEGNASRSAQFSAKRGVFIHERPKSRVVFYAYPNW